MTFLMIAGLPTACYSPDHGSGSILVPARVPARDISIGVTVPSSTLNGASNLHVTLKLLVDYFPISPRGFVVCGKVGTKVL